MANSRKHWNVCSVEAALDVIGGRWKPAILFALVEHRQLRFAQLRRILAEVTERMLTLQLRGLERDGLISRYDHGGFPLRVEYRLTEMGAALGPLLFALKGWSDEWIAAPSLSAPEQASRTA